VGLIAMGINLEVIRGTYEGSPEDNGRNLLAALAPDANGPKRKVSPTPAPMSRVAHLRCGQDRLRPLDAVGVGKEG